MISGIRSLSATHEQIILAWTGDIESGPVGRASSHSTGNSQNKKVGSKTLSEDDKTTLEAEIRNYQSALDSGPERKKLHYVPVFLDDKVAHGHYEGYCKTSE